MLNFKKPILVARKIYLKYKYGYLIDAFQIALSKSKSAIPVIIISYNNGNYVKNTTLQLNRYQITPIVIDNHSTDKPTTATLKFLEESGQALVIRCHKNLGHLVGFMEPLYECLPKIFAYTDPDLQFNSNLPSNFLSELANITTQYKVYKAGFSLQIDTPKKIIPNYFKKNKSKPFSFYKVYSIQDWESRFWRFRILNDDLEIYCAPIDTTFAVYNKDNFNCDFFDAVRVAGNYQAIHLPWFPELDLLNEEEKKIYTKNNKSTTWVK